MSLKKKEYLFFLITPFSSLFIFLFFDESLYFFFFFLTVSLPLVFLFFDEGLYPFFFLLTRVCISSSYLFIFWQGFVFLPLIFLSFYLFIFLSFYLFIFWRKFVSLPLIFLFFDEVLCTFLLSFDKGIVFLPLIFSKDKRVYYPSL